MENGHIVNGHDPAMAETALAAKPIAPAEAVSPPKPTQNPDSSSDEDDLPLSKLKIAQSSNSDKENVTPKKKPFKAAKSSLAGQKRVGDQTNPENSSSAVVNGKMGSDSDDDMPLSKLRKG